MNCNLPGSSVHGILQGKNPGVGCHFLLQGIFPTQRSNPVLLCLLLWQVESLPLNHLRNQVANQGEFHMGYSPLWGIFHFHNTAEPLLALLPTPSLSLQNIMHTC